MAAEGGRGKGKPQNIELCPQSLKWFLSGSLKGTFADWGGYGSYGLSKGWTGMGIWGR